MRVSPIINRDNTAIPVYLQIVDHVRHSLNSGELMNGERLPPIRDLAHTLQVNRDTVALAYEQLQREGLVSAEVGRGTFVCAPPVRLKSVNPPAFANVVDRLLDTELARPRYAAGADCIPLHALVPDPDLYPATEFKQALNRVLKRGNNGILAYGEHQGDETLRQRIAERFAQHEFAVGAHEIVLCQGASQGISLALRLYAEPGDWVAVEEPTYHNVLAVLVALGLRAAPVPMTPEGPDLTALQRVLSRPEVKLFYTMPSFHNPMGITTKLPHRRQLVRLAGELGKPIIEDAFEMDLRYEGAPIMPLAGIDQHDLVVHLFSFSKSLFPGLRVGAISAKGRAVEGLRALKHATDLSCSPLLQAAVAELVENGAYGRHLRKLRKTLKQRRDVMLDALSRHVPCAQWTKPNGGYQVWLQLEAGTDSRELLALARQHGVLFAPGYQFNHDGRPASSLRLTTALANETQIEAGVAALGMALQRYRDEHVVTRSARAVHV